MDCLKTIKIIQNGTSHTVPCGRCGFCLMNKRSSWMFRVFHEMKNQAQPGWFITLTYDEKHVKRTPDKRLSLRFRDVQLMLKRLRKAKHYAKYICVGEYGGQTKRPHYHLLLWTDCKPEKIATYWAMGQVHIGRITMASAMYTLKYIIQPKQKEESGLEPTRAQFSKGLGLSYLSTAVYNYHTDDYNNPVMLSKINGATVGLPNYYKYKIFTKFQKGLEAYRNKRRKVKEERKQRFALMDQGIKGVKAYMQALRVTQASRIIEKTKYKQTL